MEAATLSNPQRKYEVVPVQKSLSLPSYAKAGGEGIDHRIIFAALEQKEKVRRKSVIFKREKTARPNIFCLPIPSSAKCRETSLSSDTSCSSLEYQKPKAASKPKKEVKPSKNETTPVSEPSVIKTSQSEIETNPSHHEVASANGAVDQERQQSQQTVAEYFRKGYRSPSATLRPNINSSDSMDRSSRSSNDSLSRKERLVAIKAKVEAAREKYGDTSSEDEKRGGITRYNSDGVIHRTVKEVKSRSNRLEKRLRRRSQDEYAMRKANRKNNLSLCLSSVDDGINLDLYNSPLNVLEGEQNLECKTDFCPSPNFLDFTKKNYFSDFPSKENMTRMVQTRIRQIEEEERKRRHSLDFRDKTRQSLQNIENSSPSSTQRRNAYSSDKAMSNATSEGFNCPSPVGRAPTPPPRSPKSISFVNIAYMQHKNSSLKQNIRSLERKKFYNPIISATEWEVKDLFKVRRKTCSHFDYTEDFAIKDLSSKPDRSPIYPDIAKKWRNQGTNVSPSQSSAKLLNTKGYFSNNEGSPVLSESPHRVCRSKWEETEKKQEFMFNSLESKKRTVSPSWIKSGTPQKTNSCFCHFLTGDKSICLCEHGEKQRDRFVCHGDDDDMKLGGSYDYYVALKREQEARSRLSKSEANVSCSEQTKHKLYNPNFADAEVKDQNDAKRDNWHGEKQTDRFVCHGDDDDIKFGGSYDYDDDMKLGGSYDYYVALKREQEARSRLSKSEANVSCSEQTKHKLHNPNFADAEVKDQNDAKRDNWHGEKQTDRFVCHGDDDDIKFGGSYDYDDDMKLGGSYDYYVALKREQEVRSRLSKSIANVSCSKLKHKLHNPNFADAEVKDQNDAKRDNWHGEKQTDRFVCHGDDDDIKFGGSYDYDDDMKLGGSYDYYVALKREQEVRSRLSKSIANVSCSKLKHKLHNPNFADAEVKDQNDARRDNWQNENLSATANLDIAMEELEKVYRSLKFSGDIVSEKNSDSNLSLNDLNTDASRNLDLNKNTDISLKPCPTKGNNIDFYENISYNVKPVFNGGHEGICISPAYSSISSNAPSKSLDTENICIDELFNDLTRQLNIEQKFLKDHRDNRNENRSISLENDNCDKRESRRMGSLDSIVSIRKELYNNLQKSSQERMKPLDSLFIALNSQKEKLEKQAKMVESFSERISNLEANVNSFPVKKNMLQNSEPSSYNMETCPNTSPKPYKHPVKPPQIEAKKEVQQPIVPEKASKSILEIIPMPNIMDFNPKIKELLFENSGSSNYNMETTPSMSPKLYKHALKPSQIETKKEVLLEQAALSEGALISDILKKQVEEIRQLRVSMGWDVSEVKPMPKSQFHDYPRLSSAVSKPHATSRNESQCLPPSNILKEPIEVLNEYDLETLLNTLVNDVSEAKQSSPLLSNGNPPSTPPPAPSSDSRYY